MGDSAAILVLSAWAQVATPVQAFPVLSPKALVVLCTPSTLSTLHCAPRVFIETGKRLLKQEITSSRVFSELAAKYSSW